MAGMRFVPPTILYFGRKSSGARAGSHNCDGIGFAEFQPRRRLEDWPRDVEELADELGIERFAVIGNSGGAPYAVACGAKLPQRIARILILCGLGPLEQSDCLKNMLFSTRLA